MAQQQSRSPGRGKPSPEVFRRRRIVAAVALLIVLALLVWAVVSLVGLFAGGSDKAGPAAAGTSSSAAPSSTASASASEAASGSDGAPASGGGSSSAEAAGDTCPSGDIEVSAATDQSTYGAAEKPILEMKIINTGPKDCTVNVGTSQQEFSIVSGSDRIFSTTDCRKDSSDSQMLLKAGASETARFTWDRLRSAPGCKSVETKPRPGTYTFAAKLGDVESGKVNFSLK